MSVAIKEELPPSLSVSALGYRLMVDVEGKRVFITDGDGVLRKAENPNEPSELYFQIFGPRKINVGFAKLLLWHKYGIEAISQGERPWGFLLVIAGDNFRPN
jgi:hypothetical protein